MKFLKKIITSALAALALAVTPVHAVGTYYITTDGGPGFVNGEWRDDVTTPCYTFAWMIANANDKAQYNVDGAVFWLEAGDYTAQTPSELALTGYNSTRRLVIRGVPDYPDSVSVSQLFFLFYAGDYVTVRDLSTTGKVEFGHTGTYTHEADSLISLHIAGAVSLNRLNNSYVGSCTGGNGTDGDKLSIIMGDTDSAPLQKWDTSQLVIENCTFNLLSTGKTMEVTCASYLSLLNNTFTLVHNSVGSDGETPCTVKGMRNSYWYNNDFTISVLNASNKKFNFRDTVRDNSFVENTFLSGVGSAAYHFSFMDSGATLTGRFDGMNIWQGNIFVLPDSSGSYFQYQYVTDGDQLSKNIFYCGPGGFNFNSIAVKNLLFTNNTVYTTGTSPLSAMSNLGSTAPSYFALNIFGGVGVLSMTYPAAPTYTVTHTDNLYFATSGSAPDGDYANPSFSQIANPTLATYFMPTVPTYVYNSTRYRGAKDDTEAPVVTITYPTIGGNELIRHDKDTPLPITWTVATDNVGISELDIEWSTNNSTWSTLVNNTANDGADSSWTPGDQYSFLWIRIKVVDHRGNTTYSTCDRFATVSSTDPEHDPYRDPFDP